MINLRTCEKGKQAKVLSLGAVLHLNLGLYVSGLKVPISGDNCRESRGVRRYETSGR